jgi:hypothetical protein
MYKRVKAMIARMAAAAPTAMPAIAPVLILFSVPPSLTGRLETFAAVDDEVEAEVEEIWFFVALLVDAFVGPGPKADVVGETGLTCRPAGQFARPIDCCVIQLALLLGATS